jgi:hypothetical protein
MACAMPRHCTVSPPTSDFPPNVTAAKNPSATMSSTPRQMPCCASGESLLHAERSGTVEPPFRTFGGFGLSPPPRRARFEVVRLLLPFAM